MIRILIADDSAFIRKVLSDLFTKQPDFEVVGTATNGKEAVEKAVKLKPDLLTMDVNMPVMDGLKALEVIMKDCPMPVVMFSSLTQKGTDATVRALEIGAVDFLSKAGGSISKIDTLEGEILATCRVAAQANVRRKPRQASGAEQDDLPSMKRIEMPKRETLQMPKKPTATSLFGNRIKPLSPTSARPVRGKTRLTEAKAGASSSAGSGVVPMGSVGNGARKLVAIGTSTGGPKALQSVITKLPGNLPCGVVIVQHMPAGFTKSLADRLNSISEVSVKEAENHDIIKPGHVYIAPGNYHMTVQPKGLEREIVLNQDPPLGSHRPAVNVLFDSVVQFGKDVVSVIMTGMGCDGATGMQKIKRAGGYIIAENEETSVVYGMPKAVVDLGIADEVVPLQNIAKVIVEAVRK